jgi:nucleotide-binding universal stress UspA family protein
MLADMSTGDFTKILVTTDLSDEALKAYPFVRSLAKAYNAKIYVLTCIDTSIQLGVGGSMEMPVMYVPETIAAIKEKTINELKAHLQTHFPEQSPEYIVREAAMPVHHIITDFINESGVDLVVMASHGRSGIRRTFMGSVAEQVLRASPKPVLVVPAKEA